MISASDLKFEALLLRGREVAQLIGCSRAMAYRLMQRRVIPTVRVPGGKSVRVPRQALIEWIKANTQGGAGIAPVSLPNDKAEKIAVEATATLAGRARS